MYYYKEDIGGSSDEDPTNVKEIRQIYSSCLLKELADLLINDPEGAYEHICEYCFHLERFELYEVVKSLALSISYCLTDIGNEIYSLAGNYILDVNKKLK